MLPSLLYIHTQSGSHAVSSFLSPSRFTELYMYISRSQMFSPSWQILLALEECACIVGTVDEQNFLPLNRECHLDHVVLNVALPPPPPPFIPVIMMSTLHDTFPQTSEIMLHILSNGNSKWLLYVVKNFRKMITFEPAVIKTSVVPLSNTADSVLTY